MMLRLKPKQNKATKSNKPFSPPSVGQSATTILKLDYKKTFFPFPRFLGPSHSMPSCACERAPEFVRLNFGEVSTCPTRPTSSSPPSTVIRPYVGSLILGLSCFPPICVCLCVSVCVCVCVCGVGLSLSLSLSLTLTPSMSLSFFFSHPNSFSLAPPFLLLSLPLSLSLEI